MHTDGTLPVKGCKQGERGLDRQKFSFETDTHTDRQTDRGQVHVLSCAFAAKNASFRIYYNEILYYYSKVHS